MDSATILALEEVWLQKSPTEEEMVIPLKNSTLGQCPKSEQVDWAISQQCWAVVREEKTGVVHSFLVNVEFKKNLNASCFFALIPRIGATKDIKEYRTISLFVGGVASHSLKFKMVTL